MEPTARLAGFFAAHAIWSVSDGETLVTFVGSETSDGHREIDRFVTDESVTRAREHLLENPQHVARAVLAFDGYVDAPDAKTAAIRLEAREYGLEARSFEIVVPYRNAKSRVGLAVYRPKLLNVPPGLTDCGSLLDAFWAGVGSHEVASKVWNAHADQSR